jgi:hypothetical protein
LSCIPGGTDTHFLLECLAEVVDAGVSHHVGYAVDGIVAGGCPGRRGI